MQTIHGGLPTKMWSLFEADVWKWNTWNMRKEGKLSHDGNIWKNWRKWMKDSNHERRKELKEVERMNGRWKHLTPVFVLLMLQKSQTTTWNGARNPANNGIYHHIKWFFPDFSTINSTSLPFIAGPPGQWWRDSCGVRSPDHVSWVVEVPQWPYKWLSLGLFHPYEWILCS